MEAEDISQISRMSSQTVNRLLFADVSSTSFASSNTNLIHFILTRSNCTSKIPLCLKKEHYIWLLQNMGKNKENDIPFSEHFQHSISFTFFMFFYGKNYFR